MTTDPGLTTQRGNTMTEDTNNLAGWATVPGAPLTRREKADHSAIEEAIGHAPIQFWGCPIEAHWERTGPDGVSMPTVVWRPGPDGSDVAHCLTPGCGRTSADASHLPATAAGTAELAATLAEIGARYQAKRGELAAADLDPYRAANLLAGMTDEELAASYQAHGAGLVILDDPHPPARTAAEEKAVRAATTAWWRSTELTRAGLLKPNLRLWTAVVSPDCLCSWQDQPEGFVLEGVDAACPLHGLTSLTAAEQAERAQTLATIAAGMGVTPVEGLPPGAGHWAKFGQAANEELRHRAAGMLVDLAGDADQRIVWLANVWAAAQDRRTFDNDPTALRLLDAIDDAKLIASGGEPAPPRPAPAHLAVDTSSRGFDRLPRIEGRHGGVVQGSVGVLESSAASGPYLWLGIDELNDPPAKATLHLGVHQATLLADQIVHLAGGHYQLQGDPVIAEATLLAHQAIQALSDLIATALTPDEDDEDDEDDDDDEI